MKLYGISSALVPDKDNPEIMTFTCTPISVRDGDPEHFEVVSGLEFTARLNSNNPEELQACFVRYVDTLERLTSLQEHSLKLHHLPYRPVMLEIGQDSRSPLDIDDLSARIFGLPFADPETSASPVPVKHSTLAQAKQYLHSCRRLRDLLGKCHLQLGSYTIGEDEVADIIEDAAQSMELLVYQHIKNEYPHAAAPYEYMKELAYKRGRKYGQMVTEVPETFSEAPLQILKKDPKLKEKYPIYYFYDWDEDFRKEFKRGFHETYIGPHNRNFKLACDTRNPPFSDPCADRIRDQFEIVNGRRSEDGVIDDANERLMIMGMLERVIEVQQRELKKMQDSDVDKEHVQQLQSRTGRPGDFQRS